MLSKLDALIVLVTAATGMAMVEARNRTEIELPQRAQVAAAMTLETCLEQAEYRRRAVRVMLIMAGGLPDTNPQAQAKSALATCKDLQGFTPDEPAGRDRLGHQGGSARRGSGEIVDSAHTLPAHRRM
jgi:hypothetical protein